MQNERKPSRTAVRRLGRVSLAWRRVSRIVTGGVLSRGIRRLLAMATTAYHNRLSLFRAFGGLAAPLELERAAIVTHEVSA